MNNFIYMEHVFSFEAQEKCKNEHFYIDSN